MLSALFMVTRLQRVYFCFKASMMDHHTRVPLQRETTEPDPQKRGWEERQKKPNCAASSKGLNTRAKM